MKKTQFVTTAIAIFLVFTLIGCGRPGNTATSSDISSTAGNSSHEESGNELSSSVLNGTGLSSTEESGGSTSIPDSGSSKPPKQKPASSTEARDSSSKPKKSASSKSTSFKSPSSQKPTSSKDSPSKDTSSKKTASKPVSSKEPENTGNAWGSKSQMTSDSKAYAKSVGLKWDSSLNSGNSHWVTPISSQGFSSSSAFKDKVNSRTSYLKSQGFESIHVYFEKSGDYYKVYHYAG